MAYGNPWQLIWVFDNDDSTNVVCEGYSKAFQYLCDKGFAGSSTISCDTVTGTMGGATGAGNHMWNLVTIDGDSYLADITNSDTAYSRNRIRHNVITELKKINPGLEKSAARCMDSLIEDERFLSSLADKTVSSAIRDNGYSADTIAAAPSPVRRRAIAKIIRKEIGSDIDMLSVTETDRIVSLYVKDGVGKTAQLANGRFARTRAGLLEFPLIEAQPTEEKIILKEGFNRFGNYMIAVSLVAAADYNSQNVSKDFSLYFGDFDKINGEITARRRLPGDVIRQSKRGISKQIRKIQNERKIPPEIRDGMPVICDESGVLCAYGCGIDSRFAVTEKTEKVIIIRFEECAKC